VTYIAETKLEEMYSAAFDYWSLFINLGFLVNSSRSLIKSYFMPLWAIHLFLFDSYSIGSFPLCRKLWLSSWRIVIYFHSKSVVSSTY
jgi:hypothetical protein